jgi:hypothetical protein
MYLNEYVVFYLSQTRINGFNIEKQQQFESLFSHRNYCENRKLF